MIKASHNQQPSAARVRARGETEAQVLLASRRRCCLCVGLERDYRMLVQTARLLVTPLPVTDDRQGETGIAGPGRFLTESTTPDRATPKRFDL